MPDPSPDLLAANERLLAPRAQLARPADAQYEPCHRQMDQQLVPNQRRINQRRRLPHRGRTKPGRKKKRPLRQGLYRAGRGAQCRLFPPTNHSQPKHPPTAHYRPLSKTSHPLLPSALYLLPSPCIPPWPWPCCAGTQEVAWQHGRAALAFTDQRGQPGAAGSSYQAYRLPNRYIGPHRRLTGRPKRLHRQLIDLCHKGYAGNGQPESEPGTAVSPPSASGTCWGREWHEAETCRFRRAEQTCRGYKG